MKDKTPRVGLAFGLALLVSACLVIGFFGGAVFWYHVL